MTKRYILLLLIFASAFSFGQSLNSYKYLVMSKRYSFQTTINEYRLNSNARFILAEQGFHVLFDDDVLPDDLAKDRCKAMYLDINDPDAFLTTKLIVTFKDCQNKTLFVCQDGTSKEKQKYIAYNEALVVALNSVRPLKYKYDGGNVASVPTPVVTSSVAENVLSAKAITNGFQLTDSQNNLIMTILKTSNKDCFLATKNNIQGVLLAKGDRWFFEYYENNQLVSEEVKVLFKEGN